MQNLRASVRTLVFLNLAFLLACSPGGTSPKATKRSELWSSIPSMANARGGHTATQLNGGQVLVVGGVNSGGTASLNSAELYDIYSDTWSSVGSMNNARHGHAAVQLNDGRVLVAGGAQLVGGVMTLLNDTEIFDPSTNTWSVGPSMSVGRDLLTASLDQASGSVFLTGGRTYGFGCSSLPCFVSSGVLDVIDSSGSLSTLSPVSPSRYNHTAVVVNSLLFVFGGTTRTTSSSSTTDSVAMFDMSTTGTWQSKANMPSAGAGVGAIDLVVNSGQILVAGGRNSIGVFNPNAAIYNTSTDNWSGTGSPVTARSPIYFGRLPSGRILAVGTDSTAEIYDAVSGTWAAETNLLNGLVPMSATELPLIGGAGGILVAGGISGGSFSASSQVYRERNWSNDGSSLPGKINNRAVLLGPDQVLDMGGQSGSILSAAQIYDRATGAWTSTSPMNTARHNFTATTLWDGRVLVVGGETPGGTTATAELYDPSTGTWSYTQPLPAARSSHVAVLLEATGSVLVAGGRSSSGIPFTSCYLFDPSTNTWSATGSNSTAHPQTVATVDLVGDVFLFGGNLTTGVESYSWATGTWTTRGSLLSARFNAGAVTLPSGLILIAGGVDSSGYLASAELYDPAASGGFGVASTTGTMNENRSSLGAIRFENSALMIGGFGGTFAFGFPRATAEYYDLLTGTWVLIPSMQYARYSFQVLPIGSVMAVGGNPFVSTNEVLQ